MSELNIEELKAAAPGTTPDELPVIPKGVSSDSAMAIRDLVGTLEKHDGMIPRCAWHAKAIRELLVLIERLQVAEDAAKRTTMGSAEPIAYLREQDANTDNACLFVANKVDTGSFAVYTAPPSTDVKNLAIIEIIGCFEAAEAEGLHDAIAFSSDERLVDLLNRRILFAFAAAIAAKEPIP